MPVIKIVSSEVLATGRGLKVRLVGRRAIESVAMDASNVGDIVVGGQ